MKNMNKIILGFVAVTFLGVSSNAHAAKEPFIGEIMMTGANYCPKGWANLNGQLLPINQNQALFSLRGNDVWG